MKIHLKCYMNIVLCWTFVTASLLNVGNWGRSRLDNIVPKPKKTIRSVCRTDGFCGISLTSVTYKAMYSIVHSRLVHMVEVKQLVAEKQGGFKNGRGCSVQSQWCCWDRSRQ